MSAPRIWTRRPRVIEPRDPISSHLGMAGEWRVRVGKRDHSLPRIDTGFFPNLILNSGLDCWGNVTAKFARCRVGASNASPANSQTDVQSLIASTTTIQATNYGVDGTPGEAGYYTWMERTFRFAEGVAAGNIAEICVGPATGNMYSRALILDGDGAPTTLTVLSDEYLDATYRHRVYANWDGTDTEGSFDVAGVGTINTLLRVLDHDNWSHQWLTNELLQVQTAGSNFVPSNRVGDGGLIDANSSITAIGSVGGTSSNATYVPGAYARDWTINFGLNQGNVAGGIDRLGILCGTALNDGIGTAWQFAFDTPIPKTSSDVLALNGRTTWGRRSI